MNTKIMSEFKTGDIVVRISRWCGASTKLGYMRRIQRIYRKDLIFNGTYYNKKHFRPATEHETIMYNSGNKYTTVEPQKGTMEVW